eukprot:jgi/Tetstr1/436195/TSEL_025040.t1
MQLQSTVTPTSQCRNQALAWSLVYEPEKELCFAAARGEGICSGDSGAPLVQYDISKQSWVQVGVIAYGPSVCGNGPDYAVRVSHYLDSIIDFVKDDEVQVEEILAQPQLGQAFASFLVLPTAPSSEWSPAQEQQARLLVLKALQVDPLGEGRADTHVSKLEIFGRQHGVSPPETLKRSTVAIWGSCLGAVAFFALLAAAAIVIRCRRASTPSRKNSGDSGMGVRLFASETPPPAAWQHEQAARKAGPRPQLLHMSMGSIGVPSGMFKEILGSKKGQGAWEELHSEASTPSAAPRDGMPAGSRDSGPLFLEPPETRLSDWVDSPSPLPSLRLPPLLVGSSGPPRIPTRRPARVGK